MFEFIFVLLALAYYGCRIVSEKQELKEADKRTQNFINELQSDNERWIRTVVDSKLEYDISRLSDDEIERMKLRILNEAQLDSITPEMIVMGLLAQKAKIPKEIAEQGVRSRGVWDYAEQQRWAEQRRFMIWYDKELGRNGLQEPLLFVDGVNASKVRHNIRVAKPVTETSEVIGGRYFWAPMRINVYY